MSDPNPSSRLDSEATADDLLYGFDVCNQESRDFLCSVIASGQAPPAELEELRQLSLMRGVEEWDMLLEHASILQQRSEAAERAKNVHVERSLVPFIDAALAGRNAQDLGSGALAQSGNESEKLGRAKERHEPGAPKKNWSRRKGVSHFWDDAGEVGGKAGARQLLRADAPPFATHDQENTQNHYAAVTNSTSSANGTADGASTPEAQPTATQTAQAGGLPALDRQDKVTSVPDADQNQSPRVYSQLPLPNAASPSKIEPRRGADRAVNAARASKSPFFAPSTPPEKKKPSPATPSTSTKKPRPPRGTISSLPVPPLSADRFGLIQEQLADNPFRLLIAVTFLIRTAGKAAIPVFWQLMERFPGPEELADADPAEIIALIRPLGLSVVRCAAIQKYARMWLERPPSRDVRYGVKNYPRPGDGRHVRAGEEFGPEDGGDGCAVVNAAGGCPVDAVADARERAIGSAWEIGHLTQGPYALDSWRIFCRDVLLGRSEHWTGKRDVPEFQPEWMRVLPRDKELRACLRWMWMREGWEWDPLTGEREPLRDEMRRAVDEGCVGYDEHGNLVILDQAADVGQ